MNKIIHFDLELKFKSEEQQRKAVRWFMEDDIDWHIESYKELTATSQQYIVVVHDMSWANNLKRVGKFLEKIDEDLI